MRRTSADSRDYIAWHEQFSGKNCGFGLRYSLTRRFHARLFLEITESFTPTLIARDHSPILTRGSDTPLSRFTSRFTAFVALRIQRSSPASNIACSLSRKWRVILYGK